MNPLKKILIFALLISSTACTFDHMNNAYETSVYPRIHVIETGKTYVGEKVDIYERRDAENNIDRLVKSRTIENGSEMLCDLTNKLYMIKSQYRGGQVAILQEGLTCTFDVIKEIVSKTDHKIVKVEIFK